jgi:hypothetical protein
MTLHHISSILESELEPLGINADRCGCAINPSFRCKIRTDGKIHKVIIRRVIESKLDQINQCLFLDSIKPLFGLNRAHVEHIKLMGRVSPKGRHWFQDGKFVYNIRHEPCDYLIYKDWNADAVMINDNNEYDIQKIIMFRYLMSVKLSDINHIMMKDDTIYSYGDVFVKLEEERQITSKEYQILQGQFITVMKELIGIEDDFNKEQTDEQLSYIYSQLSSTPYSASIISYIDKIRNRLYDMSDMFFN